MAVTSRRRPRITITFLCAAVAACCASRTASADEVSFEVGVPVQRSTDPISKALLGLEGIKAVDWNEEKKPKGTE